MIVNEMYFLSHTQVHLYFQSNYYTDFYTYKASVLGIYRRRKMKSY